MDTVLRRKQGRGAQPHFLRESLGTLSSPSGALEAERRQQVLEGQSHTGMLFLAALTTRFCSDLSQRKQLSAGRQSLLPPALPPFLFAPHLLWPEGRRDRGLWALQEATHTRGALGSRFYPDPSCLCPLIPAAPGAGPIPGDIPHSEHTGRDSPPPPPPPPAHHGNTARAGPFQR